MFLSSFFRESSAFGKVAIHGGKSGADNVVPCVSESSKINRPIIKEIQLYKFVLYIY